jgi:hypothetical protein
MSFISGAAWAGFGASSTFAKVNIGSLQAGELTRLSSKHQPLTVTNTSDIPVTLTLRMKRPPKQEVDHGFDPIPTIEWAVLEKTEFKLAPGESATTDIILRPSTDKKFRKKSYQLHILSRVVSSGNIRIVMTHKLQFSLAKETSAITRISGTKTKNMVQPSVIEVKNIDLGRLSQSPERVIVIHNTCREPHRYRIRTYNPEAVSEFEHQSSPVSAPVIQNSAAGKAEFSLQPGEQKTISPANGMTVVFDSLLPRNWVSLGVKEFQLKAGEKREFPVKIFLPPYAPLKSQALVSLMRITQIDGEYPSTIIPIYIKTTDQIFEDPAPREFQKPVYADVRIEMAE